jgi:cyclopropane fatty-acyl-phospholipid synthase-like methyltransferase
MAIQLDQELRLPPQLGVRDYYDANTWKFLLASEEQAIHRELWGPGVTTRGEAVHYAHALTLGQLGPSDRRVLDLGCGVGTAALYLARRRPVDVVGVSISPEQVRLAHRFAERGEPLQGNVRFAVADFTALPSELSGFDLAFAIEAFVHADPAAAFFEHAARALKPGGALVIVDDVRAADHHAPALDDFRAGWHAPSVLSVPQAKALAADAGLKLVASHDLSPMQRLGRPRDRLIHALQPLLRRLRRHSMWAQSLVGGHALQHCHRTGLLEYRMLRFERAVA